LPLSHKKTSIFPTEKTPLTVKENLRLSSAGDGAVSGAILTVIRHQINSI